MSMPVTRPALTREELEKQVTVLRARVLDVSRWHTASPRGYCTECGFPHPCRSLTRLTGQAERRTR